MRHQTTNNDLDDQETIVKEELKGFSRTLTGIQWLLRILVLLYIKLSIEVFEASTIYLLPGIIVFALYVIIFHYIFPHYTTTRLGLAFETWVMIAFITYVLWHTGKIDSPLFSLYFIVIITSTITLGEKITFFEVALISACFFLLSFTPTSLSNLSLRQISGPLIHIFTIWCIAFLGAMLSRQTDLARKKIQYISQIDYLTGLWNMKTFTSLLMKELKRSMRL